MRTINLTLFENIVKDNRTQLRRCLEGWYRIKGKKQDHQSIAERIG